MQDQLKLQYLWVCVCVCVCVYNKAGLGSNLGENNFNNNTLTYKP